VSVPAWVEVNRPSVRAASVLAASLAAAGIGLAVVWALVAPRAVWVTQSSGGYLKDANTKAFAGADVWFLLLGVVVGVAAGAGAFALVRRRGPLVGVGLFAGSLAGSALAATVGHWLTLGQFAASALAAPGGSSVRYFLTVRAQAVIFAWPLAAQLCLLLSTLWRWPHAPPAVADLPDLWALAEVHDTEQVPRSS
jgi:hypothetical protein